MSRYIVNEVLNQPEDFVSFMMNDFLTKHGFKLVEFKGQRVFRAGGGLFEMPKFVVWNYQNGVFHMEAWIRILILPGVYGREKDLSGFYGAVPKKMYKDDLQQLITLLHQPVGNAPQNMSQSAADGAAPVKTPIVVQGVDTSRYANMALGFGIAGLATCWLWVGLFMNIVAIIYAVKGWKSLKGARAIAGLVCSIIGLVIMLILLFCNFLTVIW